MERKRLGDILVRKGKITNEQLDEALGLQKNEGRYLGDVLIDLGYISQEELSKILSSSRKRARIGEILVRGGHLKEDHLAAALERQKEENRPLGEILIEEGYINYNDFLRAMSVHFNMPIIPLKRFVPQVSIEDVLEENVLLPANVVVLENTDAALKIALAEPSPQILDDLRDFLPKHKVVDIALSRADEIEVALDRLEAASADRAGEKLVLYQERTAAKKGRRPSEHAVRILDLILSTAIKKGASDIHFESTEEGPLLRFRIDGILHTLDSPPGFRAEYAAILSRLKILTNTMRIDERVIPQDGGFKADYYMRERLKTIGFRVGTVCTKHGENATVRVLDQERASIELEELGFSGECYRSYISMIDQPTGMVLLVGPTGTGKTTTLYASIQRLLKAGGGRKIVTAEDPIEYGFKTGVVQTEVNVPRHVTFARLLQAFLRQDPDIILVGEIRERDTAETAIKAVQTGHLLLSTLHSTDATSSVARLRELGIDPAVFLSHTTGIMGQRLVRKLCVNCARPYDPDPGLIRAYFGDEDPGFGFLRAEGCDVCSFEGFLGRVPLNEVWAITEEQLTQITDYRDAREVRRNAVRHGLRTFYDDGVEKLSRQLTTIEQVLHTVPHIEEDRALSRENRIPSDPAELTIVTAS